MTAATKNPTSSLLDGIRVLDLSRVLAGPWAGQVLADLGADVIKIEKPHVGDDTRAWGPPFLETSDDASNESAYFLCTNRGKSSVTIDISRPEGETLIRQLAAKSDVLIENFKVGGLTKYGLGWDELQRINPRLVYCSITGFGQEGPYRDRLGYDFLIQGMGGLMGVTGEPGGSPMKAGVAVTDLFTGMYAATGNTRCANRTAAQRKRSADRYRTVRRADRDDGESDDELSRLRSAADAAGQRSPEHRAVPIVLDSGWYVARRCRQRRAICAIRASDRPPRSRRRSAVFSATRIASRTATCCFRKFKHSWRRRVPRRGSKN